MGSLPGPAEPSVQRGAIRQKSLLHFYSGKKCHSIQRCDFRARERTLPADWTIFGHNSRFAMRIREVNWPQRNNRELDGRGFSSAPHQGDLRRVWVPWVCGLVMKTSRSSIAALEERVMSTSMRIMLVLLTIALAHVPAALGSEPMHFYARPANGLAMTPPMGWDSWNHFGCHVNAALIKREARAMVSSGMKAAGYRYVIIDDCWQGGRDANGNIYPSHKRFPQGMKSLVSYVHSLGLKFGIYSDAGDQTCEGRPGSRGHEYQDALQYARWGVDYLKYDWCNTGGLRPRAAYATMSDALRAAGRPIVFSICDWGVRKPWRWGAAAGGNLWRTTPDIRDAWSGRHGFSLGVLNILDRQVGLARYAGPGHWNDPDMLEIGNGGMTNAQYRAQFSLWAILAAPLIAGNDLAHMSAATRAILTNRGVIAVDQDRLGIEGRPVYRHGNAEIWARPLAGGREAVVLLNRGTRPLHIRLKWSELGLPGYLPLRLRDLWRHKDLPVATQGVTFKVAPTSVVMLRETPARPGASH